MEPHYPALLVYEDGSISVLPDNSAWPGDPDLWYWSKRTDYLVDSSGMRFDQVGERAEEGRPEQPPTWQPNRELTLQEIKQLCRQHFLTENYDVEQMMEPIEKMSGQDAPKMIIEYLQSLEPPAGYGGSGFRPKTWWQFGLFGSLILFLMTGMNFLKALPDLIQGNAPWHELPLFTAQVIAIGFVCGLAVWAVQPLWRNFGTLGDVVTGIIVLDVMFVCCMLIFDPDMLFKRHDQAAFMFLLGSAAGAFGGYIMGKDIRKDAAANPVDYDSSDSPFRR